MDNNFAQEVFDHAPIGLVYAKFRFIISCNAHFLGMFGYAHDELIGKSMAVLYATNEEYAKVGEIWDKALRKAGHYDDVRIMKRKDGSLFWVRGRGKSLNIFEPFEKGVWSYEDLTERKEIVQLSLRERQAAMLLIEGQSAKEIARALNISPRTAEAHRSSLMRKYDAKSTGELIARLASMPI